MELRVLVAVFVTLFGIAVGMAGGDVEGDRLLDRLSEMDDTTDLTDLNPGMFFDGEFDFFGDDTPPEATHPVTAELVTEEQLEVAVDYPATVTVRPGMDADIQVADAAVSQQSSDPVRLHGFTGTLLFGEQLTVSGTTGAVATTPLTMNYTSQKEVTLSTTNASGRMAVTGQDISFGAVSGKIGVESTEINLAQDKARFVGFDGDIQFNQTTDRYRFAFDGAVAKAVFREEPTQMTIGD